MKIDKLIYMNSLRPIDLRKDPWALMFFNNKVYLIDGCKIKEMLSMDTAITCLSKEANPHSVDYIRSLLIHEHKWLHDTVIYSRTKFYEWRKEQC